MKWDSVKKKKRTGHRESGGEREEGRERQEGKGCRILHSEF